MMLVYLVCLILEPLRFLQMVEPTHWHTEWSYINIINVIDIALRLSIMGYWDKRNFEVSEHELVLWFSTSLSFKVKRTAEKKENYLIFIIHYTAFN